MTVMTLAQTVDYVAQFIAILLPIFLVWRYRAKGVVFGALAVWVTLGMVGALLSALDPQRDAALLDSIWLLFGWIAGLIYCVLIYFTLRLMTLLWHAARKCVAR